MVVDDDEMLRRSTCGLLKAYPNVEVVCEGRDGADAVTKARGYRPDLVLMDITMPIMNGLEATRIIKREMRSIQIVVVSGQDALREALSAGTSGYVMKSELAERLVTEILKFRPLNPSEASEHDAIANGI